jgi:hypothetical protein
MTARAISTVAAIPGEHRSPNANEVRARSRIPALVTLLATLTLSPWIQAAEMVVQGEVVDVVPITDSARATSGDCHPRKPPADAGLVELLEWDLRTTCDAEPSSARISGYRVYYRWDGRTYSRVMPEPPGETVSLRVRLD